MNYLKNPGKYGLANLGKYVGTGIAVAGMALSSVSCDTLMLRPRENAVLVLDLDTSPPLKGEKTYKTILDTWLYGEGLMPNPKTRKDFGRFLESWNRRYNPGFKTEDPTSAGRLMLPDSDGNGHFPLLEYLFSDRMTVIREYDPTISFDENLIRSLKEKEREKQKSRPSVDRRIVADSLSGNEQNRG